MTTRYIGQLNEHVSHTATFAKGNIRHGWTPASYFQDPCACFYRSTVSIFQLIFPFLKFTYCHFFLLFFKVKSQYIFYFSKNIPLRVVLNKRFGSSKSYKKTTVKEDCIRSL